MQNNVGKKIKGLRDALGESQADFAFRFQVEQATVSRWEKGEPVQRKSQEAIAKLAGMSVAEFFFTKAEPRLIPIVGRISSGESFTPTDSTPPGAEIDHVLLNIGDDAQVAVRVTGDSMRPVYRDGDVIIGRKLCGRDLAKAIGCDCIVKTVQGDGYVKAVQKGTRPGHFRLRSYNPAYEDIENVRVEWAAPIKWVGRA